MTDWGLIGGHPAPGSPHGVDAVGSAFTQLAERVDHVRQDLRQTGARSGVGVWKGEAAESFRQQIADLPSELVTVSVSYRQGAAAMRTYAAALRREQSLAGRTVARAEQAAADAARAERARNDAQAQIDSLIGRLRHARADRDRRQTQYNAAPDAESRSALYPALTAARTLVRRLDNDLRAATAERDRQERLRQDAARRLEDAKADGDRIRSRINDAAETAARALEHAEKDAHLPNWVTRASEDAEVWWAANGPVIADSLDLGVTLFSAAAKLFPPGAPVFLTFAAVCGAGAFTINLCEMIHSPEGVTTENLLHLGGEALSVVAAVAGLGALAQAHKAVGAARLAQVANNARLNTVADVASRTAAQAAASGQRLTSIANAVDWAKDGVAVLEGGAGDGFAGAGRAAVGVVVGRSAGYLTSQALRGSIRGLNKNPATSAWLNQASGSLAQTHSTAAPGSLSTTMTDLAGGQRAVQSMLGFGYIPPGGALPGHGGLKLLDSHALSATATDNAFKAVGEHVPDEVGDAAEWLIERFSGSVSEPSTEESDTITLPIRRSDQNGAT